MSEEYFEPIKLTDFKEAKQQRRARLIEQYMGCLVTRVGAEMEYDVEEYVEFASLVADAVIKATEEE